MEGSFSPERSADVLAADTLQQVLDDTRQRFIASFPPQCDALDRLVGDVARSGARGPVAELTHIVHRLSGLAGTVGFPTVSTRAAHLELLVDAVHSGAFDGPLAQDGLAALRDAFALDLGRVTPRAAGPPDVSHHDIILLAEDEPDQQLIVGTCLERSGYTVVGVARGDLVVESARARRPALILLDIAMPGLDGYSVCRLLKADAELADIPVVFMTTGGKLDDRLAGLALGAEEFLAKPVDMRELVLRVQLLLKRAGHGRTSAAPAAPASRLLSSDDFLVLAAETIGRAPAALGMVRVPPERRADAALLLAGELRGRDAIGIHGPARLLVLMPETTATEAALRLESIVDRLVGHDLADVCAGVAAASGTGFRDVAALVGEAEEALAEARYLGRRTAVWRERPSVPSDVPVTRTVVLAEDDPDITRIVDAQMRAGGYRTVITFDGEQALAAVRTHGPEVLVLDLMLPKLSGFDVLSQLRERPAPRPHVIVLSGRGREQDVMRAFDLGADDYMTKPFNPQELMVRVGRLLRSSG